MEALQTGRILWFSALKNFGCILCENHTCALLRGEDLIDIHGPPVAGQRLCFKVVYKKNALWAKQATLLLPLPDELSDGVPDDLGDAPGRHSHR
ncbi:hypothetical protein [Pseudomonas putida]